MLLFCLLREIVIVMDLIPSGMMNATLESYMIRITSRSKVIYWIIIITVFSSLAILPFIYVDVAVRARGVFEQEESISKNLDVNGEDLHGLYGIIYVKPEEIGQIDVSQKITLSVDALNEKAWGLLEAEIVTISDELLIENSTASFRVICKPAKEFLTLDNGLKAGLKSGMGFTARIIVARKSLFKIIFENSGSLVKQDSTIK